MNKPIHAKPQLYTYCFIQLKEVAKEFGYNLVVHGSMSRDLDLIAIPWIDDPRPELEMIKALSYAVGGNIQNESIKALPGGRNSYVIDLNRGGYKRNESGDIIDPVEFTADPEYYIDISVTPKR